MVGRHEDRHATIADEVIAAAKAGATADFRQSWPLDHLWMMGHGRGVGRTADPRGVKRACARRRSPRQLAGIRTAISPLGGNTARACLAGDPVGRLVRQSP
jgi:hypothetical protein